jgi:hypothetical protein
MLDLTGTHRVALDLLRCDPVVASAWLADYHYPRQRPAYPSAVTLYADMMAKHEWGVSTLLVCHYLGVDGSGAARPASVEDPEPLKAGRYLLNGRNRLMAVVESGASVPFLIEMHETEIEDDVHNLYSWQDRGRSRTVADVFRSVALEHELNLPIGHLRICGEAFQHITTEFNPRRRWLTDAYARVAFVREWREPARLWHEALRGARSAFRNHITASPVTAVAMVTLRDQPEKALKFWSDIATQDALRLGTPEKTLVDWLTDNRVREHGEAHYARFIATGWNAWFVGNEVERLVVRDMDGPINIVGTSFERRRVQRRKAPTNGDGEEPTDDE